MGRAYAGILGPLAFTTVLVHGLIHSASVDETLWQAALALAAFAVAGCLAGLVAGQIVEDAVRSRLTAEIAKRTTEKPAATTR